MLEAKSFNPPLVNISIFRCCVFISKYVQTVEFGGTVMEMDPTRASVMDYHDMFGTPHTLLFQAFVIVPDSLGFIKPFTYDVEGKLDIF